jgi:flavin reductase (DIM6/NTAB) family NADH-FMN oxidoreductase RutF
MDDFDRGRRGMVAIDPDATSVADTYKLMTGSVIPRPIALVSTLGPMGPNAAPFSFFNAIAVDPPTIMFSASPREGVEKDTLQNIRALPEFVVHIVDATLAEKMNICATAFARGTDEMAEAGLRTAPSLKVRPLRILDCPVQLECRLVQMLPIGRMPYHLVIGARSCSFTIVRASSTSASMSMWISSTRSGGWPAMAAIPASPTASSCR